MNAWKRELDQRVARRSTKIEKRADKVTQRHVDRFGRLPVAFIDGRYVFGRQA